MSEYIQLTPRRTAAMAAGVVLAASLAGCSNDKAITRFVYVECPKISTDNSVSTYPQYIDTVGKEMQFMCRPLLNSLPPEQEVLFSPADVQINEDENANPSGLGYFRIDLVLDGTSPKDPVADLLKPDRKSSDLITLREDAVLMNPPEVLFTYPDIPEIR